MTEPNQTSDRLREQQRQFERHSEQITQESSENLHRIATSGLEIWKGYLSFGTSVVQAWCDTLQNTRSSVEQMASSGQNQNRRAS
jgi:hypothetical protein